MLVATLAAPAAAQDWRGAYIGAGISHDRITFEDKTWGPGKVDDNSTGAAMFAGYNFQSGNWVFGPELQWRNQNVDANDGAFLLPASAGHAKSIRGRVGYAMGKFLPYVALGLTTTDVDADHEGLGDPYDVASDRAWGKSLAIGADYAMTDKAFVRVEVQRTRYGDDRLDFYNGDVHTYKMSSTSIMVGVGIRF